MTNPASTDVDDRNRDEDDESRVADRLGELTAVVIENDQGSDECTLYPRGVADEELVTKWITAEEGSYVELEEMR